MENEDVGKPLTPRTSSFADSKERLPLNRAQMLQLRQLAKEFADLFNLPESDRTEQAVYDMVAVFVSKGGMSIDEAIEKLALSFTLTDRKCHGSPPSES